MTCQLNYKFLAPEYTQLLYILSTLPILKSTFQIGRYIMIKKTFVSLLATLFVVGAFVTLAGCNTMAGAGQDIEQGGKAIKDEANEQKN